jgi:hypothetical protein
MYPLLLGKLRTHVKHPFHLDRLILWFCRRAGPKELFAPKGIRTLDLMRLSQRPRPLPQGVGLYNRGFPHVSLV